MLIQYNHGTLSMNVLFITNKFRVGKMLESGENNHSESGRNNQF